MKSHSCYMSIHVLLYFAVLLKCFKGPPRQLIHMDAQTHAQLQQMDPQQRALFLQHIQKRQLHHLQRQLQVGQTSYKKN